MQKGYVYDRTKPMGRRFRPDFNPELCPKEMLQLGAFAGNTSLIASKNFRRAGSGKQSSSPDGRGASLRFFGVNASQPL
jgi:hypothetical protein